MVPLLYNWSIFDFIFTILFIMDVVLIDWAGPSINPSIIPALVLVFRILRMLRAGRLLWMIVDHIIAKQLKFDLDTTKGSVEAIHAMLSKLDCDGRNEIWDKYRNLLQVELVKGKMRLGELYKNVPDITHSVLHHQNKQAKLSTEQNKLKKKQKSGRLDKKIAKELCSELEVEKDKLDRTPPTLQLPQHEVTLRNLAWFRSLEEDVAAAVVGKAELVTYKQGDVIYQQGAQVSCVYIVVTGLVKIFYSVLMNIPEVLYLGDVLGEMEFVRNENAKATAVCATNLQVYVLPTTDLEQEIPELTSILRIRMAEQLELQKRVEYTVRTHREGEELTCTPTALIRAANELLLKRIGQCFQCGQRSRVSPNGGETEPGDDVAGNCSSTITTDMPNNRATLPEETILQVDSRSSFCSSLTSMSSEDDINIYPWPSFSREPPSPSCTSPAAA